MAEDFKIQISIKPGNPPMLNLRSDSPEEFEALVAWAEQSPACAAFFEGVQKATGATESPAGAPAGTGAQEPAVRGYNEPCRDCGRPQTVIKQPGPGQKWSPFASCGVWDDFHKAKAEERKKK